MKRPKKKQRNPAFGREVNLQCYVCETIDPEMPMPAGYSVCTKCAAMTPLQILNLDRQTRARALVAIVAKAALPKFKEMLAGTISKIPQLSEVDQRHERR